MLVRVLYKNGAVRLVPEGEVDRLIRDEELVALRRDDGWAPIGETPLRKRDLPFEGAGRRWSDIDQMWKAISRGAETTRHL